MNQNQKNMVYIIIFALIVFIALGIIVYVKMKG